MSQDPDKRGRADEPEYRVYKGNAATQAGRAGGGRPGGVERPYNTYRSTPRGLVARLRGETDPELEERAELSRREREDRSGVRPRRRRFGRGRFTPWRVVRYVLGAIVTWLLLSFVIFLISAQTKSGALPAGASAQLTSGSPMLFSPNNILIVGLDTRPKTGAGSKEPGSNYSDKNARTDTIMLWHVGGGVSRRLSIPRDTLVHIPGFGMSKINAAWTYGGPGLTIRTVKALTGLQINHMIVINLANFPKFIDDIGGVTVTTPRICSNISGGAKAGGFSLYLRPGDHHLTGIQAMVLARTRENSCNPAYNDLNREAEQQQILNGIKSQLFSLHAFFNLPWAAWDAPGVIETDMGGLTLMQLFLSSEIGGSAPPALLKESGQVVGGQDVLVPSTSNVHAAVAKLING